MNIVEKIEETKDCEINYSDLQTIKNNEEALSWTQKQLLQDSHSEYKLKNWRYDPSYFENARLMVWAEPVYALKFCRCGMRNDVNPSGLCSKRQFCPRCAELEFLNQWEKFNKSFKKESFYSFTFSYNGNLGLDTEGRQKCLVHWNAIQSAVKKLLQDGVIKGGIVSEELSVRSFLPTLVLPHAHAILVGDDLGDYLIDDITEALNKYRGPGGSQIELAPSIQISELKTVCDFEHLLRYLFKPINVVAAYRNAWAQVENGQPAWKLNSDLKEFFTGHLELTRNRKMVKVFGCMHATHKKYIGQGKKDKKKVSVPKGVFSLSKLMEKQQKQVVAAAA